MANATRVNPKITKQMRRALINSKPPPPLEPTIQEWIEMEKDFLLYGRDVNGWSYKDLETKMKSLGVTVTARTLAQYLSAYPADDKRSKPTFDADNAGKKKTKKQTIKAVPDTGQSVEKDSEAKTPFGNLAKKTGT